MLLYLWIPDSCDSELLHLYKDPRAAWACLQALPPPGPMKVMMKTTCAQLMS